MGQASLRMPGGGTLRKSQASLARFVEHSPHTAAQVGANPQQTALRLTVGNTSTTVWPEAVLEVGGLGRQP